MSTDEAARHRLHDRLVDALGEEPAGTLMRHLPAIEASQLATRADLQALGDRLDHRMERLDDRLDQQTRTFVITTIGSLATLGALAFAAATLI